MAITVRGVEQDLTITEWAIHQEWHSKVAPAPAGLIVGGTATAGAADRAVTVSTFDAVAPGVTIKSTTSVTVNAVANTSGSTRTDTLCYQVDWTGTATTAGSVVILQGAAVPVKTPGVKWQEPIALLTVANNATVVTVTPIAIKADTGLVAASLGGGFELTTSTPLSLSRKGGGPVHLNGRFTRSTGQTTIAAGVESGLGGGVVVPQQFWPAREAVTVAVFDIANTAAVASLRIQTDGTAFLEPITKSLAAGDVLRVNTSWEK